jgi:hypothetical protein
MGENIKMDLQEIGPDGVHRIHLGQNKDKWQALVNTVMKFGVPQNVGNYLTSRGTISFSRRTLFHRVGCLVRRHPQTPSMSQFITSV